MEPTFLISTTSDNIRYEVTTRVEEGNGIKFDMKLDLGILNPKNKSNNDFSGVSISCNGVGEMSNLNSWIDDVNNIVFTSKKAQNLIYCKIYIDSSAEIESILEIIKSNAIDFIRSPIGDLHSMCGRIKMKDIDDDGKWWDQKYTKFD